MSFSFDDLATSGISSPTATHETVFCHRCRAPKRVERATGRCDECGTVIWSGPAPHEREGKADSRTAFASSGDPLLQALLSSIAPQFVSLGGGAGGGGAGGMEALAAAQRGVDIEQLMTQLMMESSSSATTPAAKSYISSLSPIKLEQKDFVQLCLGIDGSSRLFYPTNAYFGENLIATHKNGTTGPQERLRCPLREGKPEDGSAPLDMECKAAAVLLQRGKVTYVAKCRNAQQAGALAAIVSQTDDTWPYVMGDEAKQGGDITIPCLMVSKKEGEALKQALKEFQRKASAGGASDLVVRIFTVDLNLACSICRDDFTVGSEAVKLPCKHYYHADCLKPWLERNHTCPLCRHPLPTEQKPALRKPGEDDDFTRDWVS